MFKKNYLSFDHILKLTAYSTALISAMSSEIAAQKPPVVPKPPPPAEDFTLYYLMLFVLVVGLIGAVVWFLKSKKAEKEAVLKTPEIKKDDWESESVDADKEMEWLRKHRKVVGKKETLKLKQQKLAKLLQSADKPSSVNAASTENTANDKPSKPEIKTAVAADTYLPIFSIRRLELARPFDDLPISNDSSLMDAIEQTYDEMEEDSEVRELAVRILAAFKTRNSVEALSQVALYDLLANLRSKSISVLSEFDHESVFETILLACADPTREVRAAAARGLTKLTFDRADAWTRIGESDEEGRVVQSARAAVESGFVDMSFDRLIHQDRKYAYEAFALMALLIKAGETEKIFDALENHKNMNVRKAVLHIIKITKDQRALDGLLLLLENGKLPIEFQEEVDKAVEEIGYVTA
jgi:HEAT repeat protein